MSDDRLIRLAEGLLEKTRSGSILWEESEEVYVFEYATQKGSVKIESVDRDDNSPHSLAVFNAEGKEVDRVSSSRADPTGRDLLHLLSKLYEAAKRRALGTDQVIDDLFEELDL